MITYRLAKNGDEKEVLKVIGEALSKYGLSLEPNGEDFDVSDIEKYYLNNSGWFEVVLDDNKIVGSVGVYHIDENECELRKMYLLEGYQGKGIGKKLMDDALNMGRELGYKVMTLQTNSLLHKAIPLYEKSGFKYNSSEVCSRCDISMEKRGLYQNKFDTIR